MAAYWHILLPLEFSIEDKAEMNSLFEAQYRQDFSFVKELEYKKVLVMPQQSNELLFQHTERHYQLSAEILKQEFLAFYRLFMYEFRKLYMTDRPKFFSHAFETDLLEDFMRELEDLNCEGFESRCIQALEQMPDNYFLHFEQLIPQYVYEGYPFPSQLHSSLKVVCLLHSNEKMGTSTAETLAFHNFVQFFKEKYQHKFRLAQYLFTAGF